MATIRGNFSQLLAPGLNDVMFEWLKEHPEEYSQFLKVGTSKRAYEQDQIIAGLGLARIKPEQENITYDDPEQGGSRGGNDRQNRRRSDLSAILQADAGTPNVEDVGGLEGLVLVLLNVRMIFLPVIFCAPLDVVNSPVSLSSAIFPLKLISNSRSPNFMTILKLTWSSSRTIFLTGVEPYIPLMSELTVSLCLRLPRSEAISRSHLPIRAPPISSPVVSASPLSDLKTPVMFRLIVPSKVLSHWLSPALITRLKVNCPRSYLRSVTAVSPRPLFHFPSSR